jgi:hypothetical protein
VLTLFCKFQAIFNLQNKKLKVISFDRSSIRAAVGLNLKNSIVIVDEAHNLLETITNIHRLPDSSFARKTTS